jgi:rSAM/selenodomain-associated transferase 2
MGARDTPISVVIPALDEEASIARCIRSVAAEAEVIVVDGCSCDRTREVAESEGARVFSCPPSRGAQLRVGARQATGDWLLFLHADTWLERGWAEEVRELGRYVVGGAFRLAIEAQGPGYRLVEAAVALRSRLFALPYGDQALFVRRPAYDRMGGIAALPLMEDVDFVRRLRKEGRLRLARRRAFTSPRRWERHGLLGATLRNWGVLALYATGVSPARLAQIYSTRQEGSPRGPGKSLGI